MEYIVLFLKEKSKVNLLIDFLKGLLGDIQVQDNQELIIKYNKNELIDFNEITGMLINDFAIDLILLEINSNNIEYVEVLVDVFNNIENKNFIYINDKELLAYNTKNTDEILKKEILKKYYNDYENLKIIKVYLENDMNTTTSAAILYLHRNTLINKIDKFINETNYNIRKFKDAYIIYQLLN